MHDTVSRAQQLIEMEDQYGAHNYHPLDVVISRAEGVWVWDVDGNKFMDCLAAYSAVNQGHAHPKILQTLKDQAAKVTLTSRAFRNDQLALLYKLAHDMTGFDKMLPMNTGAEAVETAIKAARKWGYHNKGIADGKAEIIVMSGNFHGRTTTIVGFSDEADYKAGFGPFTPGFKLVKYGCQESLREAFNENTVGILIEPMQGESGIVHPGEGYLKECERLCREHKALLMCDEIQSGLGRTGKMFCYEHEGVSPDIVIIGKALSGGFYPVSAILANDDVMKVFAPGQHGSTYGGNPLGCAVAITALEVLVDEKMIENSAELGKYFLERLRAVDSPKIHEVRGLGLWIGLELKESAGGARQYCEALERKGVLCKETHETTIRIAPPLVVTKEQIDWAMEQIEAVFREIG